MNMSPKFVKLESFNVLGFRYFGKNENNEISDLWTKFYLEIKKYKEFINKDKIGLCSKVNTDGDFEYYGKDHKNDEDDSVIYIYYPIE
ncbi:GyrI-like domain-containing protein [Oceanotoga teriensis]|uniref:GyrI-like domain-containing protein n=1 Tax=Oceanotoga teriensis TaxID=515440 RepID=UPI0027132FD0|nr:GyrI-like domain-containing protein [Oceanotoga teriensis]MDO7976530.1 GyrI-like domain-containing protein [Oceanotoga teriensis]